MQEKPAIIIALDQNYNDVHIMEDALADRLDAIEREIRSEGSNWPEIEEERARIINFLVQLGHPADAFARD